jgi:ech hydrogenase subunit A
VLFRSKKLLAYSTISNLGLIVACAGIGTASALWAAIFLILFHAIAKSLLFLCVGTVEHRIGSRDIDHMTGLVHRMPIVSTMILIGIGGMFLPPFGMLIAKWSSIQAFLSTFTTTGIILIGMLAYGSAATVFFWTKWMGTLVRYDPESANEDGKVSMSELIPIQIIGFLTVIVCILFPLISSALLMPFLKSIYPAVYPLMTTENVLTALFMMILIIILPFSLIYFNKSEKRAQTYISGRPGTGKTFSGSLGMTRDVTLDNYYLGSWFSEQKLLPIGTFVCITLILLIISIVGLSLIGASPDPTLGLDAVSGLEGMV